MTDVARFRFAAALLAATAVVAGCGGGEPEGDPAGIDNHLNQIDVREDAERNRLVGEARQRESVRDGEMEQNAANYAAVPD